MNEKNQSEQLAELKAQVLNLHETVSAQQTYMARLEARLGEQTYPAAPANPVEGRPTSRRKLLRRAALGAAAGVTALSAATVLTGPQAAQAAQGAFILDGPTTFALFAQNTALTSQGASAIVARAAATSGLVRASEASTVSPDGISVEGFAGAETGPATGVAGTSRSDKGIGVQGNVIGDQAVAIKAESKGKFGTAVNASSLQQGIAVLARSVDGAAVNGVSSKNIGGVFGGDRAALFILTSITDPRNRTDSHSPGEIYKDNSATLWYCVGGGTPGTWRRLSAPGTSGAMQVIDSVRIVDTRISLGAIRPGYDNATLTIQAAGVATIPAGVTAIFGAVGIINPVNAGTPFATIFSATLASPPATANLVYPGGISVSTTFAVNVGTGANAGKFKLFLRRPADITVDIQGFYF